MHELSVVNSIIKICQEEMEKYNINNVKNIKIMVGELTGLVPSCISYYFDIASKETKLNGAKLLIKNIPIRVKCMECGYEDEIEKAQITCSKCESLKLEIKSGREFFVDSMEVD